MRELRKNPNNKLLHNQITENMESLARIKDWTSLVNTDDGIAVVKEQMKSQLQREINQRKYEVDEVLKISKAQSATDICFLVDCTCSMKKYIVAAKTQIHQLTDTIIQLYAIKPRLAFIGYRDTDTDPEQLDFTDDVDTFYIFLEKLKLTSGHDRCEDVFGGLEIVPKLSWSNPNRVLIHICDAPCHGRDYHTFTKSRHDKYPKGDPKNREVSKLLLDIKRSKIIYCSIQLNKSVKKMFEEFVFIYGEVFEIHVNDPNTLMKHISMQTSSIIMNSIQSTMSSFRTSNMPLKSYTLLKKIPDWNAIEVHAVHTIEIIQPQAMDDIFRPLFFGQEYSTVLQAFSHWTYHITAGRYMVVDLQGAKTDNAYILTDPAIHCDDILRFKHTRTNLGVKGMDRFFNTHVCSEICARLELPAEKSQLLNKTKTNAYKSFEYADLLDATDEMDEATSKFEIMHLETEDQQANTTSF
ncbi:unnamed protein product [Adineta ricciae]|uniref:Alpha-type protein kinase domain-containing protein n=1 Tax=Adineta ricciae TaxID=249248 RepID=A0A815TIS0_ADIRI|nr:unnamed protein product [Adineta ricciae]CAF1630881.1 unnamed protein product [Adineta ricciae]